MVDVDGGFGAADVDGGVDGDGCAWGTSPGGDYGDGSVLDGAGNEGRQVVGRVGISAESGELGKAKFLVAGDGVCGIGHGS